MSILAALPVLVPLVAAGLMLLLRRNQLAQRVLALSVVGGVVACAVAILVIADTDGPLVLELGDWPAPIGIVLVADRLAGLLLLVSAVVSFAVLAYAIGQGVTSDAAGRGNGVVFHTSYLMLVAGVSLAYVTGDLFNLFVAFEIMLVASYVLITLDTTPGRIRASMTYVIVSLTSSLLFLTMIALVYASTGTVNLAELSEAIGTIPDGLRTTLGLLVLVVFGIKAAMVPLHFWLPDSYPTAPAPITAILAALLTKVGVYALVRTHTLVFTHDGTWKLLLGFALATLLIGALGAVAQKDLNRMMSFLLVSHIGYMLFGLALFTVLGLAGVILYMVHHIVAQATLFLVSGLMTKYTGTTAPHRMGGLAATVPMLAVLFVLPALSLSGIPPFSGFVAKLALVQAGAQVGTALTYTVVAAGLVTSLLTLYVMGKVWNQAFWNRSKDPVPDPDPTDELVVGTATLGRPMVAATAGMAAVGVAIAVLAGPLSAVSERAANDLVRPAQYRDAVFEPAGEPALADPASRGNSASPGNASPGNGAPR